MKRFWGLPQGCERVGEYTLRYRDRTFQLEYHTGMWFCHGGFDSLVNDDPDYEGFGLSVVRDDGYGAFTFNACARTVCRAIDAEYRERGAAKVRAQEQRLVEEIAARRGVDL